MPELFYKNLSKKRQQNTKAFKAPVPVREISLIANQPIVKKKAMNYLGSLIKSKIEPKLSTSAIANKDLNIIGI